MSQRLFLRLLLALALAWSGSAAQLHALAHAQYDLAALGTGAGDKAPSPLKHSSDQCLVVHALDGTAADAGAPLAIDSRTQSVVSAPVELSGALPLLAFRSRAPPLLS